MRVAPIGVCALALTACSLVNDPGRHEGTPGSDGGGGLDGTTAGDGGSSDAGPAPLAAEDACAELTDVYCSAYDTCCMMTPRRSYAECASMVLPSCQEWIEPFLFDDRTQYSPELAGALVAEARTMIESCDDAIARLFIYDLLAVFRGSSFAPTVCLTLEQYNMGDFAGLLSCRREDELTCRPSAATPASDWTCQGISRSGGSCYHLVHCDEGLFCAGAGFFNGTCTLQRNNNAKCTAADQCMSLNCSMGRCAPLDQSVYCSDLLPQPPMADVAM